MNLYHGSKINNLVPVEKGSGPFNDYGPGFYLTRDKDAAGSWGCKHDELGFIYKYFISNRDLSNLKILDLTNKENYSVLNWIAILVHFKKMDQGFAIENKEALDWLQHYYIDISKYDVVIGFRADDSYFDFPKAFISNNLALEDLEYVYKLGQLGIQYFFNSKRAINLLKKIEVVKCDNKYLGTHVRIVNQATMQYRELIHKPKLSNKTYIFDIIRKENGNN